MKRRVTVQNYVSRQSPSGQVIKEWKDLCTVWADIADVSGKEIIASGAIMNQITTRIWIRYRPDILAGYRLLWRSPNARGMAYSVDAVIPDKDHTRLELLCTVAVGGNADQTFQYLVSGLHAVDGCWRMGWLYARLRRRRSGRNGVLRRI